MYCLADPMLQPGLVAAGSKAGALTLPGDWQPQVSLTFCTAPRPGSKAAAAAAAGGANAEKAAKTEQKGGGKRARKAKAPEADGAAEGSGRQESPCSDWQAAFSCCQCCIAQAGSITILNGCCHLWLVRLSRQVSLLLLFT